MLYMLLTTFTSTFPRYLLYGIYTHTYIPIRLTIHSPFFVIWVITVSILCWADKGQIYFLHLFVHSIHCTIFLIIRFYPRICTVQENIGSVQKNIRQNRIQGSEWGYKKEKTGDSVPLKRTLSGIVFFSDLLPEKQLFCGRQQRVNELELRRDVAGQFLFNYNLCKAVLYVHCILIMWSCTFYFYSGIHKIFVSFFLIPYLRTGS